jgi:hypothetical protein
MGLLRRRNVNVGSRFLVGEENSVPRHVEGLGLPSAVPMPALEC